jgi:hypothetical protein
VALEDLEDLHEKGIRAKTSHGSRSAFHLLQDDLVAPTTERKSGFRLTILPSFGFIRCRAWLKDLEEAFVFCFQLLLRMVVEGVPLEDLMTPAER